MKKTNLKTVRRVRRFNRFYTRLLGLLGDRYLGTPVNLSGARVIFELGQRPGSRAGDIGSRLGLDRGYLSRLLAGMERKGLIEKKPDPKDGRAFLIFLTDSGVEVFDRLNENSDGQIAGLLGRLTRPEQKELVEAMARIEALLDRA